MQWAQGWARTHIYTWLLYERLERSECWSQWEQKRIHRIGLWPCVGVAMPKRRRVHSRYSLVSQLILKIHAISQYWIFGQDIECQSWNPTFKVPHFLAWLFQVRWDPFYAQHVAKGILLVCGFAFIFALLPSCPYFTQFLPLNIALALALMLIE